MTAKTMHINQVKEQLLELLRKEHAFRSYDPESVTIASISDKELIALTMRHLDEIKMLFTIYPTSNHFKPATSTASLKSRFDNIC